MPSKRKTVKVLVTQANIGSRLIGKGKGKHLPKLGGKMVRNVLKKVTARRQLGKAVSEKVKNPLTKQSILMFSRAHPAERVVVNALLSNPDLIVAKNFFRMLTVEMRKAKDPSIRRVFLMERGARGINGKIMVRFFREETSRLQKSFEGHKPTQAEKRAATEKFTARKEDFKLRLAVQNALDLAGVIDKAKREKIRSLVETTQTRARQRYEVGRKIEDDWYTNNLTNQLLKLFENQKQANTFLANYTKNIQLIDLTMAAMQEIAVERLKN